MAELLLLNGSFHTQDPTCPHSTAIAIRDGRFWAVGSDGEIRALADPGARAIDLEGRLVLPGLTDAHFHYYDWALCRRQLPLAAAFSWPDVRERLAEKVSETPPGCWILGQGWNERLGTELGGVAVLVESRALQMPVCVLFTTICIGIRRCEPVSGTKCDEHRPIVLFW